MNQPTVRSFYARFASDGRKQRLHTHLAGVQKLAFTFAVEACNARWLHSAARSGGLIHDLGKYGDPFQETLNGDRPSSPETQHAVFGAAWAAQHLGYLIGAAVQGHHTGMFDVNEARVKVRDLTLNPTGRSEEMMERL